MTMAFIDTIIIKTTRIRELADFYRKGLGLPEAQSTGEDHIGFSLESLYLGFDQIKEPIKSYPGAISLWFSVGNLDETFDKLKHLGAKIGSPPTLKPWGDRI